MKNFKQVRNLWILAGVVWLLAFIFKLAEDKSVLSLILNGIVCVLFSLTLILEDVSKYHTVET